MNRITSTNANEIRDHIMAQAMELARQTKPVVKVKTTAGTGVTIAELLEYEAMGLAAHGQGARVILDGVTAKDGKLPVNPSGGLKSRGHPIGATGVSQHVMLAMQLAGEAGAMQIPGAGVGAVFNMGGAAVANYLSILEAA